MVEMQTLFEAHSHWWKYILSVTFSSYQLCIFLGTRTARGLGICICWNSWKYLWRRKEEIVVSDRICLITFRLIDVESALIKTIFSCRYRQKTGFALTCQQKPASPVMPTLRLMKRHNIAAPIWSVTDRHDNSKTISVVFIFIIICHCGLVRTLDRTGYEFDSWQYRIYIISHDHRAYNYLGPFGVCWVHMAWHKNCVKKAPMTIALIISLSWWRRG